MDYLRPDYSETNYVATAFWCAVAVLAWLGFLEVSAWFECWWNPMLCSVCGE